MNIDTIEEIVGWIGCGLTICYFVPQLIPFIQILQGKLYFEDAPGLFMSTCYANSFLWYIYGEMIFSDQIRISNMIACIICLISMGIYLIYEIRKYLIDTILNILIIIMASWAAYKYLTIAVDDDGVVGKICFCSSILLYIYFLYIINRVIKEKNFLLIQFNYTCIYLLKATAWLAYGIITKDYYVISPYVIGIIISLIMIIIYLNFRLKYPAIGIKEFSSTIGIDSPGNEESRREDSLKIVDDNQGDIKENPVIIISKVNN